MYFNLYFNVDISLQTYSLLEIMTKTLRPAVLLFAAVFLLIDVYTLKHGKDKKQKSNTVQTTTSVPPIMTPISQVQSSTPSAPSTQSVPSTPTIQPSPQPQSQPSPQPQPQPQPQPDKPKQSDAKPQQIPDFKNGGQFQYQAGDNWYRIPVSVSESKYNMGIVYGDPKKLKIPSWIFTSLTEQHQLCDRNQDCQDVSNFVKCSDKGGACVDAGKAKYNEDAIQSKRKAKITIKNNNHSYQQNFVSPSKISLQNSIVSENELQGLLNLSPYSLLLTNTFLNFTSQPIASLLPTDPPSPTIDLQKQSMLALTDSKTIYIRTAHTKTQKISNNIKQSYKKIRLAFDKVQVSMSLPKGMLVTIKNIMKKEYFGDRCKIKEAGIVCSAEPVANFSKIALCRDQEGKECIELDIMGYVIKQVKAGKNYKFLIQENKEEQDTIILYPKIAQKYDIYCEKGQIKALVLAKKQKQQAKISQNSEQSPSTNIVSKEKEQDEDQQEKSEQSHKEKQKKKKQKQQQQEQQSEDQQKQDDKQDKKKAEKNSKNKKQNAVDKTSTTGNKNKTKNQKSKQQHENDDDDQQDEDDQDEDEQQQPKQSKQKQNKGTKTNDKVPQSIKNAQGQIQDQKKYSKGILFFIIVYGGVFIAVLVIIKLKASESIAASAIDRFLQITWYSIIRNYFNKSRGYNAPIQEQYETKGHEHVDRSDSIAVGYHYQDGKTLFWENNSVEGI